ncbi:hypothetical protein BpHYR1_024755 [Brachionus plicatilis]|uniref:Uncharacterized protein n=1 Tax=Brachionus plicatilis TaxID=10195 RepID=A0A3M7T5M7_BRAPC|nr:hypothetical protein BpHYR1_024755 [Brachionus plicatilis]
MLKKLKEKFSEEITQWSWIFDKSLFETLSIFFHQLLGVTTFVTHCYIFYRSKFFSFINFFLELFELFEQNFTMLLAMPLKYIQKDVAPKAKDERLAKA